MLILDTVILSIIYGKAFWYDLGSVKGSEVNVNVIFIHFTLQL